MSSRAFFVVCALLMLDVAAGAWCQDSSVDVAIDCAHMRSKYCAVMGGSRGCVDSCDGMNTQPECRSGEDCCCKTDKCNVPPKGAPSPPAPKPVPPPRPSPPRTSTAGEVWCFDSSVNFAVDCSSLGSKYCAVLGGERGCIDSCDIPSRSECASGADCCCKTNDCNHPSKDALSDVQPSSEKSVSSLVRQYKNWKLPQAKH